MRPRAIRPLLLAMLLCVSASCAGTDAFVASTHRGWEAQEPPSDDALTYRVFLLGDVGRFRYAMDKPVLRLLRNELETSGPDAAVVFLGDNLYCCGLPDSAAANYAEEERRLIELLHVVEEFDGRVIIIPGNHDWNNGRSGGMEQVRRQEAFVESYLSRGNVFLPDRAFPGPAEVQLSDDLTLVAIDTQWWLHGHERPFGDTGEYDLKDEGDFALQLDDVLRRHRRRIVLVAGHHPIYSNGVHGGFSPPRQHLFPLTALYDRAYVPLPVFGSMFVAFKHVVGGVQDIPGRRYSALKRILDGSFAEHDRLIYAAGHDHALQYFDFGETRHIVSATGGSSQYVAPGAKATFTSSLPGMITLQHYRDGSIWMEAWEAVGDGNEKRLLFRHQMFEGREDPADAVSVAENRTQRARVAPANSRYRAGPVKRAVFGRQNREAWATPVEAPVLDLASEAGGLTALRRGGGLQTTSLRLRGGDGELYALRSVDKDPTRSLPPSLRETVARDLLQDAISSLHPYGALIIPPLADAVEVYHTNPRLVFVPDDARLGPYREQFANRLMLLERRPDGRLDDLIPGCTADVVGAGTFYRRINGDNDHRVDQRAYARARLLDLLISDWDRHRNQWRWAACKTDDGWTYYPVAMDHDWAFNRMNGMLPSLIPLVLPKFQDFDRHYGSLRGLTTNGLEQDRRLLNELTRDDWLEIAREMQSALSDETIDRAVETWPAAIVQLDGERTREVLQARRDRLTEVAESVYRLYAGVVDVVGSNMHERFEVRRPSREETEIVVVKITREGAPRKELYRRTFHRRETREIRLYGLAGEDEFVFFDEARASIRVRAIGGNDSDRFVDHSTRANGSRKALWYDTMGGGVVTAGPGARSRQSVDPLVNIYDPAAFRWDANLPLVHLGYNRDEGALIGGGVKLIRHGFRKHPYASTQRLKASVGTAGQALNVHYDGRFTRALGAWDARVQLEIRAPNSFRNFYGLGNETTDAAPDASYYRARLRQVMFQPGIERRFNERVRLAVSPALQYSRVDEDAGRFVVVPQPGVSRDVFSDQWFGGALASLTLDDRDSRIAPMQGVEWVVQSELWQGLRNADDRYLHLSSTLSLFVTPSVGLPVTFAARAGGAHNVGSFPFYRASVLGGGFNLRGYRSTRFAGRSSAFQNLELRLKLSDISTYVARGEMGLHVFIDNGRVWTDGERSRRWHQGYGGGAWVRLFEQLVLTGTFDASAEDRGVTVALGFFY